MRHAWLCDFDGTVAPADIGAALVRRFSPGRDAERRALLERWQAGDLGHRALTEASCRLVAASRDQALAFSRGYALDPEFAPFARAARGRGDAVMIVSEGFDFYVADQLMRAGVGDLPFAANRARFEAGALVPEFPHPDPRCGTCGNCKAQHVRQHRARGFRVVFVGDGLSDRCGARAADVVFARDALLEWCLREGVAARPFLGFAALAEEMAA